MMRAVRIALAGGKSTEPARHRPGARSARRGMTPPLYRRPSLRKGVTRHAVHVPGLTSMQRTTSRRRSAGAWAREQPSRYLHRIAAEARCRPAFGRPEPAAPLSTRALQPKAARALAAHHAGERP